MSFLDRFFGPTYEKELKAIKPIVADVNSREEAIAALSDDELVSRLQANKAKVSGPDDLDAVLPDVFALVREAAKRTQGMRHYDVQLIGGVILHRGKIT